MKIKANNKEEGGGGGQFWLLCQLTIVPVIYAHILLIASIQYRQLLMSTIIPQVND